MILFAVHLLDGFLPPLWCVVGYIGAIALAGLGCWRIHDRDIPRIAMATAAFFVASSIHVPVPGSPASVHLVLNGLVGIMLGTRAGLALFVGLLMQATLIRHGGIQTLGINVLLQALPAIAAGGVFRLLAAQRTRSIESLSFWGAFLGFATVATTVINQCLLLWLANDAGVMPALLWLGLHVPVAIIEAVVVGCMISFLARVKPELLEMPPRLPARNELAESVVAADEMR